MHAKEVAAKAEWTKTNRSSDASYKYATDAEHNLKSVLGVVCSSGTVRFTVDLAPKSPYLKWKQVQGIVLKWAL